MMCLCMLKFLFYFPIGKCLFSEAIFWLYLNNLFQKNAGAARTAQLSILVPLLHFAEMDITTTIAQMVVKNVLLTISKFVGRVSLNSLISLFFIPTYPLGTAALGGVRNVTINSMLRYFCWLHTRKGPSKTGDVVTPRGLCSTFGLLSRGCS